MDEQEFTQFSQQGFNRVPVVLETLADLDTPLSVYLKLGNLPYSYLLRELPELLFVHDHSRHYDRIAGTADRRMASARATRQSVGANGATNRLEGGSESCVREGGES